MNTHRLKIILGVIALSVIWGSTWLAIKIGLQDIPPFRSAALRFIIAAAALYLWMRGKNINFPRSRRFFGQTVFLGLLMYFIPYTLVYWAEQTIDSGMAAVMFSSLTFFVLFFAHILLPDEKITIAKLFGIIIGFSGIILAFWGSVDISGLQQMPGLVAVILSGVSGGFAQVWLKRSEPQMEPVHLVTAQIMFTAFLFLIVGGVGEQGTSLSWTPTAIASFIYLALIGTALAFVIYYWLLANAQAITASYGIFAAPVMALFLGWLVLDEVITIRVILGTILLLGGIGMTYLKVNRKSTGVFEISETSEKQNQVIKS
ncbi:MAG: EamA family transporter [Pseudomonadota bacterium]